MKYAIIVQRYIRGIPCEPQVIGFADDAVSADQAMVNACINAQYNTDSIYSNVVYSVNPVFVGV